jgi:hypothetical protein
LDENHKLDPWPLEEHLRPKKWPKSRLNLNLTISEGKSIGSNPKRRSSRRAQGELKVCLLMILELMIQAADG